MTIRRTDDHRLLDQVTGISRVRDGGVWLPTRSPRFPRVLPSTCAGSTSRTARPASSGGTASWPTPGLPHRLFLPHEGFNRQVGGYAGAHITPPWVNLSTRRRGSGGRDAWLPSAVDRLRVGELMRPVYEPGKFAGWIAPPSTGINGAPPDFEYVRVDELARATGLAAPKKLIRPTGLIPPHPPPPRCALFHAQPRISPRPSIGTIAPLAAFHYRGNFSAHIAKTYRDHESSALPAAVHFLNRDRRPVGRRNGAPDHGTRAARPGRCGGNARSRSGVPAAAWHRFWRWHLA